jgi:hypothetical protein
MFLAVMLGIVLIFHNTNKGGGGTKFGTEPYIAGRHLCGFVLCAFAIFALQNIRTFPLIYWRMGNFKWRRLVHSGKFFSSLLHFFLNEFCWTTR